MIAAPAQTLAQTLARRTPRERLLLALLIVLVLPLGFVFLVALPVLDQRAAAQSARVQAEADQRWYISQQAQIEALPQAVQTPSEASLPAVGLGGIEDRLIEAGLRDAVALLANVQGDGVSLTLGDVPFVDVMQWVAGIEAEAGYTVSTLRLVSGDEGGLVSVEMRLEPQR